MSTQNNPRMDTTPLERLFVHFGTKGDVGLPIELVKTKVTGKRQELRLMQGDKSTSYSIWTFIGSNDPTVTEVPKGHMANAILIGQPFIVQIFSALGMVNEMNEVVDLSPDSTLPGVLGSIRTEFGNAAISLPEQGLNYELSVRIRKSREPTIAQQFLIPAKTIAAGIMKDRSPLMAALNACPQAVALLEQHDEALKSLAVRQELAERIAIPKNGDSSSVKSSKKSPF